MRWIVDRYSYGDPKWDVQNVIIGWQSRSILLDDDWLWQIKNQMVDPRDVPDEAWHVSTWVRTASRPEGPMIECFMAALPCITVTDREEELTVRMSVYLN